MAKVKILSVIMVALIAIGLTSVLSGCSARSEAATEEEIYQVAAVERGDITIDIAAAGNLSYSLQEDLAFDIAGTVEEVPVEVGDSVTVGQVLARLDSSEWETQLKTKENNLLQAEINIKNAEIALDNAKNPYTEEEIEEAEDELRLAEDQLRYDLRHGPESAVLQSQQNVYQKQKTLDDMEDAADDEDIEIKEMQLRLAQAQLDNAMDEVEDALDSSLEVTAPFDGFITQVNVSGGDEIMKGTVAVQVADPTKYETVLWVSETDIFDVKVGGDAEVEVDAVSMLTLPAEVTNISPTATISSGVVNYEVTVTVESLAAVRQKQQAEMAARQEEMQAMMSSGEVPPQLQAAVDSGQMTKEQAEAMMRDWQAGEGLTMEEIPSLIAEDFELKEGLSVTVSILISQASDVLLVPNSAITYLRGEAYVQVMSAEGVPEERPVQVGISDYQNTEVTEGLSEGEEVVVPETVDTGTTNFPGGFQPPPGGMMHITGGGPP